jgi:uridine kinase
LAQRIIGIRKDEEGPILVAICGWADTGKSTLAAALCGTLKTHRISADLISTDAFLNNRADRNKLGISGYNPFSINAEELSVAVATIASGQKYIYYPYDNRLGTKAPISRTISPESVIVIEGIHAFHAVIRERCCLRVFIHSDEETLRAMRARANVSKRGMNDADAWKLIEAELREFRDFILPGKTLAHVCVSVSLTFEYAIEEFCP